MWPWLRHWAPQGSPGIALSATKPTGPCPSSLCCLVNPHPYLLRQILASALILERQVKGEKSQVQIPSDGEGSGLRLNLKISILLKNTFMDQARFCDGLTELAYHIRFSYWYFIYSHASWRASHKSFPIKRYSYRSAIDTDTAYSMLK